MDSFQLIQDKIADMLSDINAATAYASSLARMLETDLPEAALSAGLLLYAERAAERKSREASQIFGAEGFDAECEVASLANDVKFLSLGFGTTEMRQLIIARALSQPLGAS